MEKSSVGTPDVDVSKWVIIYPVYINGRKTVAEGRRIAKDKCIDNPTCLEIQQACQHLRLESHIEPEKCYSRDATLRGRVRVHLKEAGIAIHPTIPNRKTLMKNMLVEIIKARKQVVATQPAVVTVADSGPRRKKKGKK
eukprot:TRINITY_DN2195_c0_g1_i1.p1 TRINITY_DN2195_c0_g1~~TRINITY_DN2195_c0_g1_i1.p1  ORF type:complete len:139 (-),score=26.52 TRINITY_DN2195_c0_g1_i1:178-594(-)